MTTTITRKGRVVKLERQEKLTAIEAYFPMIQGGGYLLVKVTREEIPDGIQLDDEIEVTLLLTNNG